MDKKSVDETIEVYDQIAPQYSARNFDHFWVDEFDFFESIVSGKKILDIGCGAGRDASVFVQQGFDYTGIDASAGMLEVASTRVPDAKFLLMDFYELKFPPESFDGFWAAASLLHIPKARVVEVMKSIRDLLKPNGVGFISVKGKRDVSDNELVIRNEKYEGKGRFFAFYGQEEFGELIKDAGFDVLKMTTHLYEENDGKQTMWLCYFVKK